MNKEMIISSSGHETMAAILEDDEVVEISIERDKSRGVAGNIYKGRVKKVLPGMQCAFVDLGLERDGFLYVGDVIDPVDALDGVDTSDTDGEGETDTQAAGGGGSGGGNGAGRGRAERFPSGELSGTPVRIRADPGRDGVADGSLLFDLRHDEHAAIPCAAGIRDPAVRALGHGRTCCGQFHPDDRPRILS